MLRSKLQYQKGFHFIFLSYKISHVLKECPPQVTEYVPEGRGREREFFIENLLVRIHLIIETILVDRPRAMGV